MVEIISVDGDNIIGCKIEGKIDTNDINKLKSITEEKLKNKKKLRIYVEVINLGGISFEAFFEDLKLAFKHYDDFEKKAVVTNSEWVKKIAPIANRFFPGIETECFSFDEKEDAIKWLKL